MPKPDSGGFTPPQVPLSEEETWGAECETRFRARPCAHSKGATRLLWAMRRSALAHRMSFCARVLMVCRAEVTCLMSELKSDVLQRLGVGSGEEGVCGVVYRCTGGGEAFLNEMGRPGQASRQFGESESLQIGGEAWR